MFEAYIPPLDSSQEEDGNGLSQLAERDRENIKEAQEIPLHLLRELNSVLAVRNEVKEKRRQEKRKTRSTKLHPQVDINTTVSVSEDCKPTTEQTSISCSEQYSGCPGDNTKLKLSSVNEGGDIPQPSHQDACKVITPGTSSHTPRSEIVTIHPDSEQGREAEQTTTEEDRHKQFVSTFSELDQRGLAQAVAAAALRAKRQQIATEEVFYDDSDDN